MSFLEKLAGSANKELVRHTLILSFSYGARLGIQAGYFILIARVLGIQGYGLFVGLLAFANAALPFSTWGSEHILVKHVSRDRSRFGEQLGVSIILSLTSSIVLALLCFGIGQAVLPDSISATAMLSLLLGELIGKSIHAQASKACLSVNYVSASGFLGNLVSFKNLVAALIFWVLPVAGDRLALWSMIYASSTVLAACISIGVAIAKIGRPVFSLQNIKTYPFREGFLFSVNQSAYSINANFDKTMLASMAPLNGAGIYAAAYRIVEISTVPINAIMTAAYSKFFKSGAQGVAGAAAFARKVLKLSGSYGLLIAILLPFMAPVVPLVLGEEYRDSVAAMRWLAPMTVLLGLRFPMGDILSSTNRQGMRSAIQVTTALINFLINLVLIPLLSWKGAAIATLISDGLQTVALWGCVLWLLRIETAAKRSGRSTEQSG